MVQELFYGYYRYLNQEHFTYPSLYAKGGGMFGLNRIDWEKNGIGPIQKSLDKGLHTNK